MQHLVNLVHAMRQLQPFVQAPLPLQLQALALVADANIDAEEGPLEQEDGEDDGNH